MADLGLLILRVSAGLMMLSHGWPKLIEFQNKMDTFPDPIGLGSPIALGLAVFAEFFCSLLLILGIRTKWASVPLFITMAVGSLIIHAADPWQKKELALLYAAVFLTLFFTGGGKYSVGSRLSGWMKE
ncbi:MAG: DoxX family protein [Pseudobdellovibrionaceae bacterium]